MKSNYNYLVKLIKPVGLQKMKVIIITTIINLLSTSFTETLKTWRSLESKYNDISKFYSLLDKFKPHKVITTETRERKIRVMNNVVKLCDYYFNFYEKAYHKSTLNEKEGCNPKQFKRVDNDLPE